MSTAEPQLNADETSPTDSTTVERQKEFLFPAVATYYQEPSRSCAARANTSGTTRATSTSIASAAC